MHLDDLSHWQHPHAFGTAEGTKAERRARWVVAVTFVMMVVEVVGGLVVGSMALLADGWHMGTHAAALGLAAFAYAFARRHTGDPRFTFGTGKVGALGGFASAIVLAVVSVLILVESAGRLRIPVHIRFDEAILVTGIGLLVNLGSALLLHGAHEHDDHDHAHRDHNLRGAYLHVLADALTSVLAIVALVAGKYLGLNWLDPAVGMVGALIIARWALGLARDTSAVLLDAEIGPVRQAEIKAAVEAEGTSQVADLHLWRIGPRHLGAIVSVVSHEPREPQHYKERLQHFEDLAHVTVEVHRCCNDGAERPEAEDRPPDRALDESTGSPVAKRSSRTPAG